MSKHKKGRLSMADTLSKAIKDSGKAVRVVAIEAGIPQPVLHRFVKGERDLTLRTAQKLADYFGLELVLPRRTRARPVR